MNEIPFKDARNRWGARKVPLIPFPYPELNRALIAGARTLPRHCGRGRQRSSLLGAFAGDRKEQILRPSALHHTYRTWPSTSRRV
ncbi:MAG: hypothetical protein ACE5JX_05490 [Acidobacteriota bacterium]